MNAPKVVPPNSIFTFKIDSQNANIRLDSFLATQFIGYSRSFFQKLIEQELVTINSKLINKSSYLLKENDEVLVKFPDAPKKLNLKPIADDLGIEIIFEHPDFLIINKPAGILVHETKSNKAQFNLVDWLLIKFQEISKVGDSQRPGIVHRLDMNTSGLLIIARNNYSHNIFSNMFKDRKIKKTYIAVAQGCPEKSGVIDLPIARHPAGNKMMCIKGKIKMPISRGDMRNAETYFKVLEYLNDAAVLEVNPLTGRTHQIRVHLSCINHPIIGDILYGKKSKYINRQALHAFKLEFEYENKNYSFEAPLPNDMLDLINMLN